MQLRRPSNRAAVRLDGRYHYLGPWGSKEAQDAYNALIARWLANGRRLPEDAAADPSATVEEVLAAWWDHAEAKYVKHGEPTSELDCYRVAMRPVRRLFAKLPAHRFGPVALEQCRAELVAAGQARESINRAISRIRTIFQFAVSREMVPVETLTALQTLEGLRTGQGGAVEPEKIRAVPEDQLDAVLDLVTPVIRSIARLQIVSAMRPGEVLILRGRDLCTRGAHGLDVWEYRPARWKTEHVEGEEQEVIYLGRQAQAIIAPYLQLDTSAYLFTGPRSRGRPYTTSGYRQAIERAWETLALKAIKAADPDRHAAVEKLRTEARKALSTLAMATGDRTAAKARYNAAYKAAYRGLHEAAADVGHPPTWHPHQLRHNGIERLEAEHGIESAQHVARHASPTTTRIYSEANKLKAAEVMSKSG